MKKKYLYQGAALCCLVLLGMPVANASFKSYTSEGDAGASALDYIENQRRIKRATRLTEDQQQLKRDAAEMQKNLKRPLKQGEKLPVSVDGDDMFYDQATGAVYARGNVKVTELDAKRVLSERIDGNLKTTEYKVEDLARLLSVTPGEQPLRADGYRLIYNFTTRQGSAENMRGKNGSRYFYGKHIEFYPEKMVIYDGWQSECSAEKPHYRMSGKIIEFYDEYMVVHNARYYLGSTCIYGKKEVVKRYDEPEGNKFPNISYSSDDGLMIKWNLEYSLLRNTNLYANLYYRSGNSHSINGFSDGFRNVYGFSWSNAGSSFSVEDGYYEDSDDRWIRKHPTFKYSYGNRIGKLPLNYSLSYENGNWSQDRGTESITSRHKAYSASISHHPIYLFGRNTWLNLSAGYSITKESYQDSETKGWSYGASLYHQIGKNLVLYGGYSYSNANSTNSVFDYDLDSYSKKYNYGLSLQLGEHDHFIFANEMNAATGCREEIEYYWLHDFHCVTGILKFRERSDGDRNGAWKFKLQFTPW